MTIKKILKGNRFTNFIIKHIRKVQYEIIPNNIPYVISSIKFNTKKLLRVMRFDRKSHYERLKTLKNKHKGERCFIVATGPSLTIEDLEKLRNEVTFSMNSICLAFNETDWRPTYYGIQDIGVFNKFEQDIKNLDVDCKFIADVISKHINISDDYFIYPLNLLNHSVFHQKYNTKFSKDVFAEVFDGYTITYSLIQIAVYMGFEEIYLLGTDCNYSSNMNHHFKNYDHVDPSFLLAGDRMISAYKEARKYADCNKIKIYNATRGGMLEVFERVDFDVLISERNEDLEQPSISASV
ncbi:6-hydroxymethylpterin diphosphokinase MptE-like protein [Bacillus salipaludis]|uniref:6-hydroxymethylpterin diphosphokinase MptE-like protein n=1 Tax=Bacillus salipaludis TaxID=2547811 RepID=A0ABW8RCE2_9BACI